jgi:hypothetical protein
MRFSVLQVLTTLALVLLLHSTGSAVSGAGWFFGNSSKSKKTSAGTRLKDSVKATASSAKELGAETADRVQADANRAAAEAKSAADRASARAKRKLNEATGEGRGLWGDAKARVRHLFRQ